MAMASSSTCPHVEDPPAPSTESSSFYRCDKCNPEQHGNTKNIIACIDGTSNKFGRQNTNVVKLLAKIDQRGQRTYYSSGVGTRPKTLGTVQYVKNKFVDNINKAIAWNVEMIIKEAYRWLSQTYKDGDRIYFFGFSRGAYQVRVLAEMIHEVGLIKEVTERQIGMAYDHYQGIRSRNLEVRSIAKKFKETFSWQNARVHFVGIWDTVSSVGPSKKEVFLSASSSAVHACQFRHALALDERRVKFMPEYLCEMNSRAYDKSEGVNDARRASNVKEVWFAGCHSDVGGQSRPGRPHHAGNISLLWMHRKAMDQGLVLKPMDISWGPEDINSGTSNSMSFAWRLFEYLPIRHQARFSGAGKIVLGFHRLRPRRVIPGQKVHASVLCASTYNPKATLGKGFDIPIADSDNPIWETVLHDNAVTYPGSQQMNTVGTVNLNRLLSMFPSYPNIDSLVRLVAVVAWHEVSCNAKLCSRTTPLTTNTLEDVFENAKRRISSMLPEPAFYDALRVTVLLRHMAKHQVLHECLFTGGVREDVFKVFFWFYDMVFLHPDWNIVQRREAFGQVVDTMNSLLEHEDNQDMLFTGLRGDSSVSPIPQMLQINRARDKTLGGRALSALIDNLGFRLPHVKVSRLNLILCSNDRHLLIAALRMVLTLVRISDGNNGRSTMVRELCCASGPRIERLAMKDDPLVGVLAIEILLALYPDQYGWHVNSLRKGVRANLTRALARVPLKKSTSADCTGCSDGDPGRQLLSKLFGLGKAKLSRPQQNLIVELKNVVETGKMQERTDATMTLLKLCETESIRTHLCDIGLLNVLVSQLQHKDSALLAAYALATCLKYDDMKSIYGHQDFVKHIVRMLELDEAIGQIEGFQIFADLIKDADLREKLKDYDLIRILTTKLGNGKRKQIRTGMVCLNTLQSFDPESTWTNELVAKSVDHLKSPMWKVQKAGLTILFALLQTERGMLAIKTHIPEIIRSLSLDMHGPPSRMMGPACALRIFSQDVTLREYMCRTTEYDNLKDTYLSGMFDTRTDTAPWRIFTPNRDDVMTTLGQMMMTVDGTVPDGSMSLGDPVLPHIRHWDRLVKEVSTRAMNKITSLATLLGISVAATLTVVPYSLIGSVLMLLQLGEACVAAL